ncbi:MAG: DNA mismatch repair endonuclease MutL [Ruminiclostridium sp.]|nr:DNA mismatch repair endonuclease MutL [Ruminiclostridium sp.]
MGKIIILDENTSNKIAAGEVVERPASAVKELVENSLDAGASSITVEIRNGGISYIKVMDNGSGMEEDDVGIAFERHSTSKIRNADDIENIRSMGFRGEALASIASVSSVQLTTRTPENSNGTSIEVQGGSIIDIKPTGCPVGTTIVIRDLFFNTPARFKFLKKDATEAGYISDVISRIALGNPNVAFKLTSNGNVVLQTPGNNDCISSIFSIYGRDTAKDVYEINFEDGKIKVSGYIGKPEIARSSRNNQSIFINRRFVRSKIITSALDEAYSTFLMKNKYAFSIINLEINPVLVDVNVHPSKMEVKFSNEQEIFKAVYHAVNNTLLAKSGIRAANPSDTVKNPFRLDKPNVPEADYKQQSFSYEKPIAKHEASIVKETRGEPSFYNTEKDDIPADMAPASSVNKYEKSENYENIHESGSLKVMESSGISDKTENREKSDKKEEYHTKEEYSNKESCENIKEIDKLTDARIIGQVFNTYILLQLQEQLILVDQHAAHERVVYEELKDRLKSKIPIAQTLITGQVIELTRREIELLNMEKAVFLNLGFDYEPFGNNSVILRTAPLSENSNSREIFLELLDYILSSGRTERDFSSDEALYRIACKAAVKANKKLDGLEINSLLKRLSVLENPYTCPHGRPSAIKISKMELEKMFKRIV